MICFEICNKQLKVFIEGGLWCCRIINNGAGSIANVIFSISKIGLRAKLNDRKIQFILTQQIVWFVKTPLMAQVGIMGGVRRHTARFLQEEVFRGFAAGVAGSCRLYVVSFQYFFIHTMVFGGSI